MPGVVAVLTGADTAQAKLGVAQPIFKFPGKGGMMLKVPHRDVLASTRVRFVGQEVALVVAETAALAHDAAEAIEVEYRDLPLVVDAEAALAPGAPQLHADISGNLCYDFEYGDEAKTADAFARAAHVTQLDARVAAHGGQPDGAQSVPRRLRRGEGRLRPLFELAGDIPHPVGPHHDLRPAGVEVPAARARRGRRLRHPLGRLRRVQRRRSSRRGNWGGR